MAENFENRFESVYRLKDLQRLKSDQKNLLNPYPDGFSFDLYVYVSENETKFESESELQFTLRPNHGLGEEESDLRSRHFVW